MRFSDSVGKEIKNALSGNSAYVRYPGVYLQEIEDYDFSSIQLDGKFTLIELEKVVSILRRVGNING